MKHRVLILRPQPGAEATALRAQSRGMEPVVAPLFSIESCPWLPRDPADFDSVMLTSANAVRCGGVGLAPFFHLPTYAVGETTAQVAADAGFADVRAGDGDADLLADRMEKEGARRAFHPCGEHHRRLSRSRLEIASVPVYAAVPVSELPPAGAAALGEGAVVLLHSPRAAGLFAALAERYRPMTRIAAISVAAADAAGGGWRETRVADRPSDAALLELAAKLCQTEADRKG